MLEQAGVQGEPSRGGQRTEEERRRNTLAASQGLAQLAAAMRSEQPGSLFEYAYMFLHGGPLHLIIIWPLRHDGDSGGSQPRLRPSSSSRRGSLSGPLLWQEHDLSNALGLLSRVHTLLSLCLSYRFYPLRHGLSL